MSFVDADVDSRGSESRRRKDAEIAWKSWILGSNHRAL